MLPLLDPAGEFIPSTGGVLLWARSFSLLAEPKAAVVLTHGLGEHSGRYEHVRDRLLADGYAVHLFDLRGHGKSTGSRGDADSTDALVDDLAAVVARTVSAACPYLLFGHSLGAQVVLRYLLDRAPAHPPCGVALSAPWLRLAGPPPWWRLLPARIARYVAPRWSQRTGVTPGQLSADLEHLASLPGAEYTHDRLSARLYCAIAAGGEEILRRAGELALPVLISHGAADSVTSPEASRQFFAGVASEEKRLIIYPECRHEPHNDCSREQVLRDLVEWLSLHIPACTAGEKG